MDTSRPEPPERAAEPRRSTGLASSFASVPDLWHHRVGSTPDAEAMRYRDADGRWRTMTWGEAGDRVRAIANGLLALGLEREQRCVVLSGTCIEWILADFAILCAGGATTTVYPEAPDTEVAYIIADCEAVVAFVDTRVQAERLLRMRDQLPSLREVFVFRGARRALSEDGWVSPLRELERRGRDFGAANPEAYTLAHRAVERDDLATLMYTSGTTGMPKGVMLSHDAWVYEAEAIDALGIMTPADVQMLWLPLAHVFAKVLELSFVRLGIPTVVDGTADELVDNLRETRPTWFAGVPRTFEKAQGWIVAAAESRGRVQRRVFRWAVDAGLRKTRAQQRHERVGVRLGIQASLADRLVFRDIRERFGGRLRFMISGGAPLPLETAEFFDAIGMTILEGYGLTESAAASCVNRPDDPHFGTVGPPMPGCEVRIAPDGEIRLRSRGVMRGYWRREGETAEAFDEQGFLRTGDIGRLLPSGHLQITGRIKEIIVTAGGKNVAPAQFEDRLRIRCPYVSHAVVHGDARPFCTALVTLDEEAVTRWAREHDVPYADLADLASRTEIRDLVQGYIDAVNRELPSFEQVRRFAILPDDFTMDNGLLTPSAKVKRQLVEERYRALIDGMYDAWRTLRTQETVPPRRRRG
ncbi:MAG: long-chain fatty acid--CoA ligase [Myxococcota bacterium]